MYICLPRIESTTKWIRVKLGNVRYTGWAVVYSMYGTHGLFQYIIVEPIVFSFLFSCSFVFLSLKIEILGEST